MSKIYSEKLKDPRWQKKRLEIMERDGFACLWCQASDKTLHVHHRWYDKGAQPWEYDNEVFQTLCEGCHESVTADLREVVSFATETTHTMRASVLVARLLRNVNSVTFEESGACLRLLKILNKLILSRQSGEDLDLRDVNRNFLLLNQYLTQAILDAGGDQYAP